MTKKNLELISPLFLYAALSIAFFSNGVSSGNIFQPGTDPIAYIWFLRWWPYSIIHGLNPFHTYEIWNPIGFSMLWANSIPTLALLMWPVTAAFGPESTWSILCLAAPALNAFSGYILIRYLVNSWRSALLGGFLFGFSPYVGSHMLGHVSLTFVPLVPLIALVAIRRARGEMRRALFIAALSSMAFMQFGISMEVLATSAFFGLLTFIVFWVTHRSSLDLKGLACDAAIAAAICCIALTPAFYYLWSGASQLPNIINSPVTFSNDLLGFIVPMRTVWVGGQALLGFTSRFSATASEQNAYLGLPLIVLSIVAFASMRRASSIKALASIIVIAALMSLGPLLWIAGTPGHFRMPGAIATIIPLLKHALPGRFAMYTDLGVAILVGTWLAQTKSLKNHGAALVAAIFMLPNPTAFQWISYSTPSVYSSTKSLSRLARRGAVVSLPYGSSGNSILWQMRSAFRFKMAGGYIGFTPRYFDAWPAVSYFSGRDLPEEISEFRTEVFGFCIVNGVGSIVIGPGTPSVLVDRLHQLQWQSYIEGDSEVIVVPPQSATPFRRIFGDAWPIPNTQKAWLGPVAIVVNNEPTEMHLALSRNGTPKEVPSIHIASANGSKQKEFTINDHDVDVVIPPWSSASLRATSFWVPSKYIPRNGDERPLSVMAEIK